MSKTWQEEYDASSKSELSSLGRSIGVDEPKRPTEKPQKLKLKTYLQVIQNSIGAKTYRNYYIKTQQGETDALEDGRLSCAFFVSSILAMFQKIDKTHATVSSTIADMEKSGWHKVKQPKPGDVLAWETRDGQDHMGFYLGDQRAVSNSTAKGLPTGHHYTFDGKRKIDHIFRTDWQV